ncbi:transmembrane protein 165 isoform X1 [Daktulosphaira vitifoliae]|uniref:transmembrane protein 165 isoform X1 n=1 Tax=Daktulosphaira vitifoliae TaxID=58002 RepID=UPI0021A992A3|nr:transmembrane protein 165 isoform X1 [Daktulosphaira vitifoliae]
MDFIKTSVVFVSICTYIAASDIDLLPLDEDESMSVTSEKNFIKQPVVSLGFVHAFVKSLSMIVVSELGDKTFFIAAIMAMRQSRFTVFAGAISALALMTVLSVLFGQAATIIRREYTYYISAALFALFGIKMLREGFKMSPNEGQDELEEVQADIRRKETEIKRVHTKFFIKEDQKISRDGHISSLPLQMTLMNEKDKKETSPVTQNADELSTTPPVVNTIIPNVDNDTKEIDIENQSPRQWQLRLGSKSLLLISQTLIQAFTMTFLAEWGDRSQIATIILAAGENAYGVALGGILGHSFCTGLAVIGGRYIAQKISVRTVTVVGGIVFIIFALTALMFDPNEGET